MLRSVETLSLSQIASSVADLAGRAREGKLRQHELEGGAEFKDALKEAQTLGYAEADPTADVEGFDAATLVQQGPSALPPQRALHIVGEAAKGLDSAHRQGLLHRDVKPANILIAANSGNVLLTDFGIARSVDSSTSMTGTGSILGTIAYAAPEQLEGGQLDHRVDVYALGCTLYEMLTGTVPFRRETPLAVMHAHLTAPPPRPTDANPALPQAIDAVIARALAKRPDDRYPSCRAFADAAAAAFAPPPLPPKRSNRLPILGAAALVLVLALVATVVAVRLLGRDRSTPEPVAAPTTSTTSTPTSTPRPRQVTERVTGAGWQVPASTLAGCAPSAPMAFPPWWAA